MILVRNGFGNSPRGNSPFRKMKDWNYCTAQKSTKTKTSAQHCTENEKSVWHYLTRNDSFPTRTKIFILEFIPLIYHTIDSIPSTILAAVWDGVWATLFVPTRRMATYKTHQPTTNASHFISYLKVRYFRQYFNVKKRKAKEEWGGILLDQYAPVHHSELSTIRVVCCRHQCQNLVSPMARKVFSKSKKIFRYIPTISMSGASHTL